MCNPFSLFGKKILITGASSGIGKGIAIECSKLGAQLIITARDSVRLSDTFKLLQGDNHLQISADLSSDEDIEKLADFIIKLDGIVNVAGIVNPKPFQFVNRTELDSVMNINFYAPVLLTNTLLRNKKINKNSSIVFITSISGILCSFVGGSTYSASKGALNGIIKGMALDFANKGIRVNSVLPGMVNTGIFDNSAISHSELEEDKKRYPLGRYGNPEDIAYAVIYLLSNASSWVTGSNLVIDGGFTLI